MVNIQQQLVATEEVMRQIWQRLAVASEGLDEVQELLADFTRQAQERDSLMKTLLAFYEKELGCANKNASDVHLSQQQTETLIRELKTLEEICNVGVRDDKAVDVAEIIMPSLFKNFVDAVEEKCPLLRNIIETLVINNHQERNVHKTNEHKVLCGHHALALLLNVRNSKSSNDFPLLFGLLCFSYGAGKQFINMMQSIGISLHFDSM